MWITPCKPEAQLGVENGTQHPATPQGLNTFRTTVVLLRSTEIERYIVIPRAALRLHGVITGLPPTEAVGVSYFPLQ